MKVHVYSPDWFEIVILGTPEIGRVIGINRRYKTPLIQGRAFIGGKEHNVQDECAQFNWIIQFALNNLMLLNLLYKANFLLK